MADSAEAKDLFPAFAKSSPAQAMNLRTWRKKEGLRKIKLLYRLHSRSDLNIINQVFKKRGYALGRWAQGRALRKYYRIELRGECPLIVDAGANIGASVRWFNAKFPRCCFFALEPDAENAAVLERNTGGVKNLILFRGAIGSKPGTLFLSRKVSDAAHRVAETGDIPVEVIDVASILALPWAEGRKPFICKIDIEGGETPLFSGNTSWVKQFPCIIMELHDWMMPFQRRSANFLKAISEHDFDVVHRGEHIFCFNNALLGHYRDDPDVMLPRSPIAPLTIGSLLRRMTGLIKGQR